MTTTYLVYVKRPRRKCRYCHKQMERHVICPGARFHVHSLHGTHDQFGHTHGEIHCSESNCEDNHGPGKCVPARKEKPNERLEKAIDTALYKYQSAIWRV